LQLASELIYSCFYFNFGIRDNFASNSCAKLALQEIRLNIAGKPLIRKMKHRKAESIKERFKPILLTNDDTFKQLQPEFTNYYTKKNQSGLKTKQNEP
jgi:hypothetical protein